MLVADPVVWDQLTLEALAVVAAELAASKVIAEAEVAAPNATKNVTRSANAFRHVNGRFVEYMFMVVGFDSGERLNASTNQGVCNNAKLARCGGAPRKETEAEV
jgi:hypothetical protein